MKVHSRTTRLALAIILASMLGLALPAASDGLWPNSKCSTKHTTATAANIHCALINAQTLWLRGFHVHQWGDGYFRCHQRR